MDWFLDWISVAVFGSGGGKALAEDVAGAGGDVAGAAGGDDAF